MSDQRSSRSAIEGLRLTRREVALYQAEIVARSTATFGVMLACHFGYIPIWTLLLVNLVLYPGIYLRMHDLGHGIPERRLGWCARFIPVTNPMWGGTRVFSYVHNHHHVYLGTERDPWLPYYTGHPLRALLFNFIELEYSYYQFVRRRGVDRELALNTLVNLALMVAGVALFQWTYVIHLLSQRVVHMTGIFFFNFYTHRESFSAKAPIGTWEREPELRSSLPLLRAVWGRDVIDGLIYHNRHHCAGQTYVPVRSYASLSDTGAFSRFIDAWPITSIKQL